MASKFGGRRRGEPAVPREFLVQFAQAVEIIVGAALRAGEFLRGRKPVERDVGPEQLEQRAGLRAAWLAPGERFDHAQAGEVHAGVRRAVELVNARRLGVMQEPVEPRVTFIGHVRLAERLAEQDEVAGVHDGDVGIAGGNLMPPTALDGEFQQLFQPGSRRGRHEIAMFLPEQRAGAHAKINGVVVHDLAILPAPPEIAEAAALGIAVLHFFGQFKEPIQAFRMLAGLAEHQRVGKQIAGTHGLRRLRTRAPETLGVGDDVAGEGVG